MRTIQVINSKWYNATAWYAVYLTKILSLHGHESLLITVPGSLLIPKAKELGTDCLKLDLNSNNPQKIYQSWQRLHTVLADFKPDIVNCHRGESFYLFGLLKKKFGYALVRTRGDQRLPKNTFLNRFLHNSAADAVITTNSAMSGYFERNLHTPAEKIHTVLGGVDCQKFYPRKEEQPLLKKRFGFSEQDVVLGIIGRLDPIKGFFEGLDAFKKALGSSPQARERLRLAVAGLNCNFTADDLRAHARRLEIPSESIRFFSFVDDMNAFMNMLDVGVIASLGSETIARVAFEMLACHTPVIGSRVGVMPDILEEKYLFRPADTEEAAKLFLKVLQKDFRERLTDSCMRRFYGNKDAKSIYGWTMEDFYQKTISIYSNLIEERK